MSPTSGDARARGELDARLEDEIAEGRAGSNEQFGSIADPGTRREVADLRFLFGWLPFLPRGLVRWLLRARRFRRLQAQRSRQCRQRRR